MKKFFIAACLTFASMHASATYYSIQAPCDGVAPIVITHDPTEEELAYYRAILAERCKKKADIPSEPVHED